MPIALNLNTMEYFVYENISEKDEILSKLYNYEDTSRKYISWIKEFKPTPYMEIIESRESKIIWEKDDKIVFIPPSNETYILTNAWKFFRIKFDDTYCRVRTRYALATILKQPFIHNINKPVLANEDLIQTIAKFI